MEYVKLSAVPNLGYARPGDAGMDLTCTISIDLKPGDKQLIPTGVRVAIPEGCFGMLVPRSSLGKRGLRLANTVGIIDAGYRGELMLFMENTGIDLEKISVGDRLAQLVVIPFLNVNPVQVSDLSDTHRGEGGFGSTG